MNIFKLIASASILLIYSQLAISAGKKDLDKEARRTTWSIQWHLKLKNLPIGPVMFAVTKKDPMADFRAELKDRKAQWSRTRSEFKDENNLLPFSETKIAWDSTFRSVPGNEINVLLDDQSKDGIKSSFSSNDFSGPQYIVTRAITDMRRGVWAWVIKLPIKKGAQSSITLSESNAINLKPIRDKIMNFK